MSFPGAATSGLKSRASASGSAVVFLTMAGHRADALVCSFGRDGFPDAANTLAGTGQENRHSDPMLPYKSDLVFGVEDEKPLTCLIFSCATAKPTLVCMREAPSTRKKIRQDKGKSATSTPMAF